MHGKTTFKIAAKVHNIKAMIPPLAMLVTFDPRHFYKSRLIF
jgi:hypothetical protein